MKDKNNMDGGSWHQVRILCIVFWLALALGACDKNTGPGKAQDEPGMVFIPGGEFIRGSNKRDDSGKKDEYGLINPLYLDEHPEHKMFLPGFYIDKYEVSNARYKAFVQASGHPEPFNWSQNGYNLIPERLRATELETLRWIASEYFQFDLDTTTMSKAQLLKVMEQSQQNKGEIPVTYVTWFDAEKYCQWAGKRLPQEAEWEKAARGELGKEYPWGMQWDPEKTNVGDNDQWDEGIAPIGAYPQNASPYGVQDLSGNVWEWVADWYKPYPGSNYKREAFGEKNRVLRGGGGGIGHYALSVFYRGAARSFAPPATTSSDIGFRCAKSATR